MTVENLLLDYEQRVVLLERFWEGVELEALRAVSGAVRALGASAGSLGKREALVLLGRHYRPPGVVLLRLRERVRRGDLDDRAQAVPVAEARAEVGSMLLQLGSMPGFDARELEAWRRAEACLASSALERIWLGALLRVLLGR
jgi:hypothetical protein